jgi:predicted dienelactone hydrolase
MRYAARVQHRTRFASLAVVASLLAACSSHDATPDTPDASTGADADAPPSPRVIAPGSSTYEQPGPSPVGHSIFTIADPARTRTLTVQAWYPAIESARVAAEAGTPMEELVPAGADRDALKGLLAKANPTCVRARTSSAADVDPAAGGKWPVVVFSHCHDCMRFSAFTIAERLASHGIAVVAPDHQGNTLFDKLRGNEVPIDDAFLEVRVGDVKKVLDVVLDATSTELPAKLRGRFDATKIGLFGHSYGSATTGRALVEDARPKAGLGIAAPWETIPFQTKMADVHVPALFILASEDNSISEIGNNVLRDNFQRGNPPLWLVEVADAGHWSFSDICGLTDAVMPGCGTAPRMTDPVFDVTYIDVASARGVAASYVTAFFAGELEDDAAGLAWASAANYGDALTVQTRK